MTLLAHPLPWPRVHPATTGAPSPRGFAELDERVSSATVGVVVVHAPSRSTSLALGAHMARRTRAAGRFALEACARRGAPLWHDVARRLGIGSLPNDPASAADAIVRAATLRRATILGALPSAGTWDRAVTAEIATFAAAPPVLLVAGEPQPTDDFAPTYTK